MSGGAHMRSVHVCEASVYGNRSLGHRTHRPRRTMCAAPTLLILAAAPHRSVYLLCLHLREAPIS
jgi:hypothetical protein